MSRSRPKLEGVFIVSRRNEDQIELKHFANLINPKLDAPIKTVSLSLNKVLSLTGSDGKEVDFSPGALLNVEEQTPVDYVGEGGHFLFRNVGPSNEIAKIHYEYVKYKLGLGGKMTTLTPDQYLATDGQFREISSKSIQKKSE